MPEKEKCEFRGKEVIGSQGYGCFVAHVSREHGDYLLLTIPPGETRTYGDCYMIRFRDNG